MIKTAWYRGKNRHIGQWNITESPEIKPHIQSINLWQSGNNIKGEKVSLASDAATYKSLRSEHIHTTCTKINSKWLKDVNLRQDTMILREENTDKTFSDTNRTNIFWGQSPKFSLVSQSHLTLGDPTDCSTPGFPVHHQLPELAQTHIHQSVMPSNHPVLCYPLLLPSIFPSIRVFSNDSALRLKWPKYWSFNFSIIPSNEYLGLIFFRIDLFDLLEVQGILKSLLQHYSSKASIIQPSLLSNSHIRTWLLEKP